MRHVTHLLTAYIHHELPPHLRSRVEKHVRSCDDCYAALGRERELARLLETRMPTFGAPRPEQLARLLPGILAQTSGSTADLPPGRPRALPGLGLALVVILLLVAPVLAGPHAAAQVAPNQPAPYMLQPTATPDITDAPGLASSPTAVALRSDAATEPAELIPPLIPVAATPVLDQ